MNNYLLFLGCLIMFVITLKSNKNSISGPSNIYTLGFLISSFMLAATTNIWGYTISLSTVIYILLGNSCFVLGCKAVGNYHSRNYSLEKIFKNLNIGFYPFLLFFLVELVGIAARLYAMVIIIGSATLQNEALGEVRQSEMETPVDSLIKWLSPIISAIVIIAIMYLFTEKIYENRYNIKSIVLMIGYFIFSMLSSARIDIIYLFVYIFVFYLIINKHDRKFKIGVKTITQLVLFAVVFFFVFILLGMLTGKSQVQSSFFENIAIYTGASIGGLDKYLQNFNYHIENMFTTTFKGLVTLCRYLNINVSQELKGSAGGFYQLGNMEHLSNTYTCYINLLHDFNYFGSVILIFFEGVVYQLIYKLSKKQLVKGKIALFGLYIYIAPYIFLSSITDRFFTTFLTITTIFFYLIINYFFKKIRFVKVRKYPKICGQYHTNEIENFMR